MNVYFLYVLFLPPTMSGLIMIVHCFFEKLEPNPLLFPIVSTMEKQAGTELGQVQLKLGLDFT